MAVQSCPCFNLGLAHRRLSRAFEEALAPIGLTMAQAHFLSCLFEHDGQLSRDLSRELGLDAGTLTPMIDRLERQGLIRRCPHPDDRRAIRLCLQPAARLLKPQIDRLLATATSQLMAMFTPEEMSQLMKLLQRLTSACGVAPEAVPVP